MILRLLEGENIMNNIKEQLEAQLKEKFKFDNGSNDFSGVMHLLKTNDDIQKMYDYINKNNITDTDDIYKYGFKLAGIDNQTIEIEK